MYNTIIYDCEHSIRMDNIYAIIRTEEPVDVQAAIVQAKAELFQELMDEYGDDSGWCLDDVWEHLEIDGEWEICSVDGFADV